MGRTFGDFQPFFGAKIRWFSSNPSKNNNLFQWMFQVPRFFFNTKNTMHGAGIFTYMKTIFDHYKATIHVGRYTFRPMDS